MNINEMMDHRSITLLLLCCALFCALFSTLFIGPVAWANTNEENKKSLSEIFPDTKKIGLLLFCDPYCNFVSINEGNRWNPEFGDKAVDPNKLRLIRPEDPEYNLLVSKHPVLPYVEDKNNKPSKKTFDPRMTISENQRKTDGETWLVSYNLGISAYKISTQSDNRILRSNESPSFLLAPQVIIETRPLRVFTFFSHSIRPLFYFETFSTASGKSTDNDFTISYREQIVGVELRTIKPKFHYLLNLELYNTHLVSSGNIVDSYPLQTLTGLIRMGLANKDWKLTLATNIYSTLNESQGFRREPFQRQLYEVTADYCSRRYQKFGFRFSACGSLSWSEDEQTSDINPELVTGFNKSRVTFQNVYMGMSLQFGDLLWE